MNLNNLPSSLSCPGLASEILIDFLWLPCVPSCSPLRGCHHPPRSHRLQCLGSLPSTLPHCWSSTWHTEIFTCASWLTLQDLQCPTSLVADILRDLLQQSTHALYTSLVYRTCWSDSRRERIWHCRQDFKETQRIKTLILSFVVAHFHAEKKNL